MKGLKFCNTFVPVLASVNKKKWKKKKQEATQLRLVPKKVFWSGAVEATMKSENKLQSPVLSILRVKFV